jgi:hypothetical protein
MYTASCTTPDLRLSKPPLPPPPANQPPPHVKLHLPLIQSLRFKHWTRRTQKEEVQFYGHGFTGCGKQELYETTAKLGEGTFGFVLWFV